MTVLQNTAQAYEQGRAIFSGWLQENCPVIAQLGPAKAAEYRTWLMSREPRLSPATINLRLVAARKFCWNFERKGLIPPGTVKSLKAIRPAETDPARKAFNEEQLERIFGTFDLGTPQGRRDNALVWLLLSTGLRAGEIPGLNVGDVGKLEGRRVVWVRPKGHQAKDRFNVLPGPAWEAVKAHLADRVYREPQDPLIGSNCRWNFGGRLGTRSVGAAVKNILRKAGITDPRLTVHSFRYTAIYLVARYCGITAAQEMAHHTTPASTLYYLRETDSPIRWGIGSGQSVNERELWDRVAKEVSNAG